MPTYQDYKTIFAGRDLPFAFVNLDLLDENIRQIAQRAGTKTVRVASKSVRTLPVLRRILAANPAVFQGIMCFSPAEALYLSRQGLDDLLLGYPCFNSSAVQALCAEIRQGKMITFMVDAPAHVQQLARIAQAENVTIPLCLDLDMSVDFPGLHFGVWRSSIRAAQPALTLFEEIQRHPQLQLTGLMGYEAQIAGLGDLNPTNPLKARIVRLLKKRSLPILAERRAETVKLLAAHGAKLRFVNGGGTGSLETTRLEDAVTEVTAGSGFFSPTLFDLYTSFRHSPAAGFAVEITRRPTRNIYTCSGGGYIASGASGPEKQPQPYLPEKAKLTGLEGAGEVQTPVLYNGPENLQIGDPIFFRHSKAGELCERFNSLLLVQNGQIIDEIPTYRGEGLCFL